MRTLRCQQISSGRWLQRIDTGDTKATATFAAECAAQFGLTVGDLLVMETDWTETVRQAAVAEMAAGTHEGLTVLAAPVPAKPPAGRDFLKLGLLPAIEGANNAARLDRLAGLLVLDPALAAFFAVCNTYAVLSSGDHTFIRKLWSRKLAVGGLTSGEVTAIQAAAPTYGITLP